MPEPKPTSMREAAPEVIAVSQPVPGMTEDGLRPHGLGTESGAKADAQSDNETDANFMLKPIPDARQNAIPKVMDVGQPCFGYKR